MTMLSRTAVAAMFSFLLLPGVAPANDQFHALSNLSTTELEPLGDQRLASIQGGLAEIGGITIVPPDVNVAIGLNLVNVFQLNFCVFCRGVVQGNVLDIGQVVDL